MPEEIPAVEVPKSRSAAVTVMGWFAVETLPVPSTVRLAVLSKIKTPGLATVKSLFNVMPVLAFSVSDPSALVLDKLRVELTDSIVNPSLIVTTSPPDASLSAVMDIAPD